MPSLKGLFFLCAALLPLSTARPAQHGHFHKRHEHHRHHNHLHSSRATEEDTRTRVPLAILGRPATDSFQLANISEAVISVSFQSIPQWPKSGEQVDLVSVPRGVWLTPGKNIPLVRVVFLRLTCVEELPSLPQHPSKAQVLNARYQKRQDRAPTPDVHLDHVSCHVYLSRSDPTQAHDQTAFVVGSFIFTIGDGEVNFADPVSPWFLGGRQLERFGCV